MSDPLFETIYSDKILSKLEKRYGPFTRHHVDLMASSEVLLGVMSKMQSKPRRGEVVMVVPNEQGHIWLHTKDFYPEGVYRLMTGGLEAGEQPDQALLREVEEETGFKTKINRCLAVITYTFTGNSRTLPFVSYVFSTVPTAGTPHPTDPDEAITAFKAVPVATLATVSDRLRAIEGRFSDWGIFRAIAHDLASAQLQSA